MLVNCKTLLGANMKNLLTSVRKTKHIYSWLANPVSLSSIGLKLCCESTQLNSRTLLLVSPLGLHMYICIHICISVCVFILGSLGLILMSSDRKRKIIPVFTVRKAKVLHFRCVLCFSSLCVAHSQFESTSIFYAEQKLWCIGYWESALLRYSGR